MRTPEMELQEYSTSFHLEKMYSTVPSSQPITVRAVTVFQSHEVFTLHCTTSVCYSTFGEPRWKREQCITTFSIHISYSTLCPLSKVQIATSHWGVLQ